jgi:triosephosphate isomerase (TIM)
MRKKLIAGNWKMHLNTHQASVLMHKLEEGVDASRDVDVVLCPNFLVLQSLSMQVNHRKFKLGAQNCYWRDEGAYTGEISATMLRGLVNYVIVGHSERRHVFGEHDSEIRHKVSAVVRNGMTPILCVGETAGERAAGETYHVLHGQVVAGLANLTSEEVENIVIAYEPVWAISGGKDFANHPVATPEDVAKAVKAIRAHIHSLYGKKAEESVRVIYGGSSNNHNAAGFMEVEGLDGLLPGGASLKAPVFTKMIEVVQKRAAEEKSKVTEG